MGHFDLTAFLHNVWYVTEQTHTNIESLCWPHWNLIVTSRICCYCPYFLVFLTALLFWRLKKKKMEESSLKFECSETRSLQFSGQQSSLSILHNLKWCKARQKRANVGLIRWRESFNQLWNLQTNPSPLNAVCKNHSSQNIHKHVNVSVALILYCMLSW